jgi:uncharacterized protein YbcI
MVRMQKEFFGKGPTKAKSYIFDDMLLVVMREGMTTAERTMLEFGHPNQVRQFRQLFQDEMTGKLTSMVESLTGRRVVNYQSQVLFDPDMSLEIFVFDSSAGQDALTTAALEQPGEAVETQPAAEVEMGPDADAGELEPPSTGGREQQPEESAA